MFMRTFFVICLRNRRPHRDRICSENLLQRFSGVGIGQLKNLRDGVGVRRGRIEFLHAFRGKTFDHEMENAMRWGSFAHKRIR